MLIDGVLPVFKLSTFAPQPTTDDNLTSPEFAAYLQTISDSYAHFRANGYSNLMIDMSRNGGGLICLAYDLLASLIFEWRNYTTEYSTVVWQYSSNRPSIIVAIAQALLLGHMICASLPSWMLRLRPLWVCLPQILS